MPTNDLIELQTIRWSAGFLVFIAQRAANQRMHASRRVELVEVVSRSRRPRDPYRYPTKGPESL